MDQSQFKIRPFWAGVFQIRVIWDLQRPQKALLFNKIPNVGLLLFMDPSVVIVQVLTIRTLFSAQRLTSLRAADAPPRRREAHATREDAARAVLDAGPGGVAW